jgi:hypothetical protein
MERKPSGGKKWSKKALKNVTLFFSWVSRQWDNLHLVLDSVLTSYSLFFFSFSFVTKKCGKVKNDGKKSVKRKRKSHTCCKGAHGAMCCGKIYGCLRFGGILDPGVLRGQLLSAFMSTSVLTHVVFSQWSFGPCGQASSRGQPNDGRNESIPCVHVWSGLCIACPYLC